MKILLFIISIVFFWNICVTEIPKSEMNAVNSYSVSYGENTIQNLSIITNERVSDYRTCAEEIIQHCIANDFQSLRFSYDAHGYPVEIIARVYETESDFENGNCLFVMTYAQESSTYEYNVVDNPEQFKLNIIPQE